MGKAANLYLCSDQKRRDGPFLVLDNDLVYSDLKFWPLCSEIATVEVVIPSEFEQKLLLATTWSLYRAKNHLI